MNDADETHQPVKKRLVRVKDHRFLGAAGRWGCVYCGLATDNLDSALFAWCSVDTSASGVSE